MLACMALPLAACSPATAAPKVVDITIDTLPTKTEYYVGDTISLDGLVVSAQYSDKSSKVITDYTTNASKIDMTTVGEKSVVVTYETKSNKFEKDFTINVSYQFKSAWTDDEKALLTKHAGEVLPVPAILADATVEEQDEMDWEGAVIGQHLIIYDDAASLTMEKYYEALLEAGWTVEKEGDSYALIDQQTGTTYYSAYKRDSEKPEIIYTLQYVYDEGNYITIRANELSKELNEATDWTDEEKEEMLGSIYMVLPFFQFGKEYQASSGEDAFYVQDNYYQDLSGGFFTAIGNAGFALSEELSEEFGYTVYATVDADQNSFIATAYFSPAYGNLYMVGFMPNTSEPTDTWPADIFTGFEAEAFDVMPLSGSNFVSYTVNGEIHLSFDTETDQYEDFFAQYINVDGLVVSVNYDFDMSSFTDYYSFTFYDWEESGYVYIKEVYELDDEWEQHFVGYELVAGLFDEPSELLDAFPINKITEDLGTGFDVPAFTDVSEKGYKYQFVADEEDSTKSYALISAYDRGEIGKDSIEDMYFKQLTTSGWWQDTSVDYDENGYVFENPDGTIKLTFFTYNNEFDLYVEAGAGEEHKPVFEINKKEASVKPGKTVQLSIEKEMIPGDILWTSDNESVATVDLNGLVTVKEDATVGQSATITATCGGYEATCAITVKDASIGWYKVTDATTLVAGDKYVLACESKNVINGAMSAANNAFLQSVEEVEFEDGEIVSDVPETSVITLGGEEGAWTFTMGDALIGATAVKKLSSSSDTRVTTWTISIDANGDATVASTNSTFGRFLYNSGSQRFTTYTSNVSSSMILPQLYHYVG